MNINNQIEIIDNTPKDKKYVIAKIGNKYIHLKSYNLDHDIILKHNGIPSKYCIEKGMIIDKKPVAIECFDVDHWNRIKHNPVKSILNDILEWIAKNEGFEKVRQIRGNGGFVSYKRSNLEGD